MIITFHITWSGPYTAKQVIGDFHDAGRPPAYNGADYGLYQIYGKHILGGADALLYVGKTVSRTFSTRFKRHVKWLKQEKRVRIFLGRLYDPDRHTPQRNWASWRNDVRLAEEILIKKYSPHYNGAEISSRLRLPENQVIVVHKGCRFRLQRRDIAPDDLWGKEKGVF